MDVEQNTKLLLDDDHHDLLQEINFRQRKRQRIINVALTVTLIGSFLVFLLIVPQFFVSSSPNSKEHSTTSLKHLRYKVIAECGTNRAEAIERGCIFDVMSVEWVPRQCYDAQYAQEATSKDSMLAHVGAAGVFQWFRDDNHTIPIEQEDLNQLENMIGYTYESFHVAHCLYSWRVLAKATRDILHGVKDMYIPGSVLGEDHIDHCNMVIGDHAARSKGRAKVTFGFGECLKLEL
jgi:hypothetical protein